MVRWGDYDADGLADVVIAGFDSATNMYTRLYRNAGNEAFIEISTGFTGVSTGGLAWADYDNNGSLDLLVTGCDRVYCSGLTKLYKNLLPPPTPTPTLPPTMTSTPTNMPTPVITPTILATMTPTPAPTETTTPKATSHFLPLVLSVTASFPIAIRDTPIPMQPSIPGAPIFYTNTITLPSSLPTGGTFYLSASPSTPVASLVDDAIVVRAQGAIIFSHDYKLNSSPTPALVQVPRSILEQVAGQSLTVEFVDLYGSHVSASPMYLVWQP
jgi:hypothetical protein